jgi:Bacterial Ig domain
MKTPDHFLPKPWRQLLVIKASRFESFLDKAGQNMRSLSSWFVGAFLAGIIFLSAGLLHAQLINVDFYSNPGGPANGGSGPGPTMSGAAVLGTAGDQWNGIATPIIISGFPLKYANGSNSTATIKFFSSGGHDANANGGYTPFAGTPYNDLMEDYLYYGNAPPTQPITLSGLATNGIYNLVLYNAADVAAGFPSGRTTYFTVNGNIQSSTWDGTSSTLIAGVDYVNFTNALSDASGNLVITCTGNGSAEGDVNGFQIQGPAPTVTITNPADGSFFLAPANVNIAANAAVSIGTVSNVQFFINGQQVGSVPTVPFGITFYGITVYNLPAGSYSIYAVATANGLSVTSPPVNISVLTPCSASFPDDFRCRATISGDNASVAANNVGATKESGEPSHGGNAGGHSLWWDWVAPYSGGVTLTTAGSDFGTLLGVYTGTNVSALTIVTSDGRANVPASVTFAATAGVDYKIAVDGTDGATGNILLNLTLQTQPANDNFSNRIGILSGTVIAAQNLGATVESGETNHAGVVGGKSVWWTWTAPSNCCAVVNTEGSDFDTVVGVYTGSSLASLVPVAATDDAINIVTSLAIFQATAGQTYQIVVDGYNRASGNIVLQVQAFPSPPNDNFANATVLTGTNISVTASNTFSATSEPGDPTGNSVWWRWTAPVSGGISLDTLGSDFQSVSAVYTGSSVSSLTQVVNPYNGHAVFKVVGGVTYNIAQSGGIGQLKLNLKFSPSPPNDDFANASSLSTTLQTISNAGATPESFLAAYYNPFPLIPRSDSWGKDVWWSWSSISTGPVAISTISSNFVGNIKVYLGNSLTNLMSFAALTGTTPTNVLWFRAVRLFTYQIVVDGNSGAEGSFTINAVRSSTAPANDNFANAIPLNGNNIFTTSENATATRETGEPNHAGNAGVGSVWWSWTSPGAGRLFLTTAGSSFSPLLAMYQGASVSSLSSVASGLYYGQNCPYFSSLDYEVIARRPQTYYIAVDGATNTPPYLGSINLALTFVPKPVNDDFNSRLPLTGSFLVVTGSVIAASQEAGEVVGGYSSGLRTVWYSWTAPNNVAGTNGSVTLRVTGISMNGTADDPIVDVFQGNSLASLIEVPEVSQLFANIRQVTFLAQPGATYQIAVAGGQSIGTGYLNSFAQRTSPNSPDPLSETGTFLLHLNYSTLALRIVNANPNGVAWKYKGPIGAAAQVVNYGASPSGPVRVRMLAMGYGTITDDENEGTFSPAANTGLLSGDTATLSVSGACTPGAVLAVLEEQSGGVWFFRDSSLVSGGAGGLDVGYDYLCSSFSGGGVALLEPGLTGNCFCPAQLTNVFINGPATVNEGSSATYTGTAFFDNGTAPTFTNSIWSTSNTNKFPITTNGILTAGSVTFDTPISVTAYYSYLGMLSGTNKPVTILNLPPPALTGLPGLANGNFQFSLQGVPGRQHIIEATTNLNAPVVWSALTTNVTSQNGSLIFTDRTATNFNHRFYRAREN